MGVPRPPEGAVTLMAPAKLNLYLHVVGRREDGYHELESLVAFAGVGDSLSVSPSSELTLTLDGPFADQLDADEDNLVWRAARAVREVAGITGGAAMTLTKNLPVASGIGGGSADAAAAIKALARLWGVRPGAHDLSGLALSLGADVPVCLYGRAAMMKGIGERIEPAPALPPAALAIVNPGVGVPTPAVFEARRGGFTPAVAPIDDPGTAAALAAALRQRRNDLSGPAVRMTPVIGEVLGALEGSAHCLLARMSGSGATCFGLFETDEQAAAAAHELRSGHPDWWVVAAPLGG